jgi:hypothetical protein
MKNIVFFGHSFLRTANKFTEHKNFNNTFVDMICKHYNVNNYEDIHVPCSSEERLLFLLKKYKKPIDIVIISHAHIQSVFCPSWAHDWISARISAEELRHCEKVDTHLRFTPTRYYTGETTHSISYKEVNAALADYREYFHNNDVQYNRYQGALMQIDHYLKYNNIRAIHLIREEYVPGWFKFTHGIVDYDFIRFQHPYHEHCSSYEVSANSVTDYGNQLIANSLIEYIDNYKHYALEYKC